MKKEPLNKLDKYLIFSVTVLIVYTVVEQILSSLYGYERSTLTTCFYAAFGGEILSCVVIKVFNIKHDAEKSDEIEMIDISEGGEG